MKNRFLWLTLTLGSIIKIAVTATVIISMKIPRNQQVDQGYLQYIKNTYTEQIQDINKGKPSNTNDYGLNAFLKNLIKASIIGTTIKKILY